VFNMGESYFLESKALERPEEGTARYPAIIRGISKKELTYGFISDIREKRS